MPALFAPWARRVASHWRRQWKSHLGTLVLMLAVLWGVSAWQTRNLPEGPAPDFTATLASGETVTLAQWRAAHPGQPVALHFWADWCPFCRAEQHSVTRVAQDWPVLTIAMQSGDAARVRAVLAQRQLAWTTVVDPQGRIAKAYGFQAVPAFVVLDANGKVRGAASGYTTEVGMRARLWLARLWPGQANPAPSA
jgi:thiol-disulfide isomerase/thioredoxin